MEVTYDYTPEDHEAWLRHVTAKQPQQNYYFYILGGVFLLFLLADIIFSLLTGSIFNWNPVTLFISLVARFLIAMGICFLISHILKAVSVKMLKGQIEAAGKNGLFCEHKVVLEEGELIEITDVNISRYSWHGIDQIEATPEFVLLPVSLGGVIAIPSRAFSDSRHLQEFVEAAHLRRDQARNNFAPSYIDRYESTLPEGDKPLQLID